VSLYTSNYLNMDLVRRVIGLDSPFTKREQDEAMFFTSLILNVVIGSLWFLGTSLFSRFNKPVFDKQVTIFFERLNQPVISDPAATRAMDRTQLRTLGILGLPYGGFVLLLALIPNPLTGRLAFVFSGGAILLVSGILVRASRRMQAQPLAAPALDLPDQPPP
jgi:hypothetical protein